MEIKKKKKKKKKRKKGDELRPIDTFLYIMTYSGIVVSGEITRSVASGGWSPTIKV